MLRSVKVSILAIAISMFLVGSGWASPTDRTAIINEGEATAITGSYSKPLVINEFLASNQSPNPPEEEGQLVDEDGDSSDWIEIYNPTDITIDLSGCRAGHRRRQSDARVAFGCGRGLYHRGQRRRHLGQFR